MNKNLAFKSLMIAASIAVSVVLAFGAWAFYTKTGLRTPGILVWDKIVAPDITSKAAASFGHMFAVQLSVDFAFWFAVIYLIYFLVKRRSN